MLSVNSDYRVIILITPQHRLIVTLKIEYSLN